MFLQKRTKKETQHIVQLKSNPQYVVPVVEVTGLEPTTSWSLTKRATKLRYTSILRPLGPEPSARSRYARAFGKSISYYKENS